MYTTFLNTKETGFAKHNFLKKTHLLDNSALLDELNIAQCHVSIPLKTSENLTILYPLKTSEDFWFFDVFRGCRNERFSDTLRRYRNGLLD